MKDFEKMYKSIFFFVIILLVWGCKEDTFEPFVEDNTASGFMLCQINSNSWSANEVLGIQRTGYIVPERNKVAYS